MINLMLGDCLERMKEIPDGSVDMILCDLPYGTTACKWDTVIPFDALWAHYKRVTKPNGAIVLFGSEPFSSLLRVSNLKWFKYDWIWHKNRATAYAAAKFRPLSNHENIHIFSSGKTTYNAQKTKGHPPTNAAKGCKQAGIYHGDGVWDYAGGITERYPLTIQKFDCDRGLHSTQKPVALCEYLIRTYTNEGETVMDNCMGSGTTGVACKNLNRNFIGIEKDETYFKIAQERIGVI
jgi:DNA modification methylase